MSSPSKEECEMIDVACKYLGENKIPLVKFARDMRKLSSTWKECVGKGKLFGTAKDVVLRASRLEYDEGTSDVSVATNPYEAILTNVGGARSIEHRAGPLVGREWLETHGSSVAGFLGTIRDDKRKDDEIASKQVFLQTGEPFCAIITGVQGSGKSHSFNVILENCLLSCPEPSSCPLIRLPTDNRMCGLVCHFEQNERNSCEARGLGSWSTEKYNNFPPDEKKAANIIVLVSPDYYVQRRESYGEEYDVRPLLFKWSSLDASQIRTLMRLDDDDQQLYVSVMLEKLRSLQRRCKKPKFDKFKDEIENELTSKGQTGPLRQRLRLLESLILESKKNIEYAEDLKTKALSTELKDIAAEGSLVIADLSDPMLTRDEANGVFTILLSHFRQLDRPFGKVVAFDEAHHYLSKNTTGLGAEILNTVRLLRHEGIRVVVSTQSPEALPPELLELVSLAIIHRYQSPSWFRFLSTKLPLNNYHDDQNDAFQRAMNLAPGCALVFAASTSLNSQNTPPNDDWQYGGNGGGIFQLAVRKRLTLDFGASRQHA